MSWMRRSPTYSLFLIIAFLFRLNTPVRAVETQRYLHNAMYDAAHERILFIGGATSESNYTRDIYSLDLSASFDRATVNLTLLASLPTNTSDAAAAVGADGDIYVIGGNHETCSSSVDVQRYNTTSDEWSILSSTGEVPSARGGAKAALVNGELLYFGGKSPINCNSSQYYFNSVYQFDPGNANWSLVPSTSSPVAESDMTMTLREDGSIFVAGGQSVASNGKASWVGMSQFATYDGNSSSWSYLSTVSNETISPRSGHSSATNGTFTFVYGGALGNDLPQQTFLSIKDAGSSFDIAILDMSNNASAPSTSLYGHSATMSRNGIMVIAFGLEGAASSNVYNGEIFLYDTVSNQWLDSYDPRANAVSTTSKKGSHDLAVPIVVPIVILLLLGTVCFILIRRRRSKRRRSRIPYPVNRLGTFTPESDLDEFEKQLSSPNMPPEQAHLPPWAAMYACQARSTSAPPGPRTHMRSASSPRLPDRGQAEVDVQDVQFACPQSPRVFTFTAPKAQLRVVNPEAEDTMIRNQSDQADQVIGSLHPINNEQDLEDLRRIASMFSHDTEVPELRGLGLKPT